MTLEILAVTCTRGTVMFYLHETALIWVISLGHDIMASLLPLVIQMALKDKKSPLKKGSIRMKFSMTGQEKGDLSIQVTS